MEYFVTANLNCDGKEYKRGDTIDFDPAHKAVQPLLAAGVIQTKPIGEAPSPAPGSTNAPETQPEVTGKPLETGESSIDGRDPERSADNATDITPPVDTGMRALSPDVRASGEMAPVAGSEAPVEPTLEMTRVELENVAFTEGANRVDVDHAPNKAALIELILENRKAKSAEKPNNQAAEPENDPSANL